MEISIRRAEPSDADAIWELFRAESVYSGTLQLPFASREIWRERLAKVHETDYILVACVDGAIVGDGGLHPNRSTPRRAHVAGLGLVVADAWQRKGVGTALMKALVGLADNWLGLLRLELNVYTDNTHAVRLYERFGFEIEGTQKRYALRNGVYVDSYMMARLRPR